MPEKLDFQKIMEIGAESFGGALGGTLASEIIERMFGEQNNTEALITEAVEEICTRLTIIIDNAFMKQSIADTDSIASRLLAYQDSNDINILDEIYADASKTFHRLKLFDTIESITACNYVSTLHLVAIKAMAEHNSGYYETLKREGKLYAEWSESTVHRFDAKGTVGEPFFFSMLSSDISNPRHLFFGYYIKESSQSSVDNQLVFYTHYRDDWEDSRKNHWRRLDSDPINVAKSFCSPPIVTPYETYLELTKDGINDITIQRECENFHKKSQQIAKDFLDERVNVSNATMESILFACKAWKA